MYTALWWIAIILLNVFHKTYLFNIGKMKNIFTKYDYEMPIHLIRVSRRWKVKLKILK